MNSILVVLGICAGISVPAGYIYLKLAGKRTENYLGEFVEIMYKIIGLGHKQKRRS